jgi:5'-nucleotidase
VPPTIVITNDDGVESPGIHSLAAIVRSLGYECVVAAPAHDMSGSSAAIGRIDVGVPTNLRPITLPPPAEAIPAYAVDGPPGLAAVLAARGALDGTPRFLVSGINAGTNTGHSILHSGTVGAALTAASFGLSGLAVSLAVADPMPWHVTSRFVDEALRLLDAAPRGTVLNVNVPSGSANGDGRLRWAALDRFGSFRVAVAERRESLVQLEYRATGYELDPASDTALVERGYATVTAIDAIRAVPPDELPFQESPPIPEPRLAEAPSTREAEERPGRAEVG